MKTLRLLRLLVLAALLAASLSYAQGPPPSSQFSRLMSDEELRIAPGATSFEVALPDGNTIKFPNIDVTATAGIKTLRGDNGSASLLLTTDGNRGFGYVLIGLRKYDITTRNGVPRITDTTGLQLDAPLRENLGDDVVINTDLIVDLMNRYATADPGIASSVADNVVNIAFFYDQAIADNEGLQSPRTMAQAAVDFTNAAIATHGVSLELNLVYVGPLSTDLNGGDPWSNFVSNTDKWTVAQDFGADLVHYIYYYGGEIYCGRGYLPGRTAVSGINCNIAVETIAHEIGHNLGLHHDRSNASHLGLPYSDYNYGFVCGNAGTLMAYFAPRVPHYSSPLLQNNGEDCGIDIGDPLAAYNAAVLPITAPLTVDFEEDQVTVGNVWIETTGPIQVDEEDEDTIAVTVMRDGDLNEMTSVEIGAVETDATANKDFADFVEPIEFGPGEATKVVHLQIFDDEAYEADPESFDVVVRYPYKLVVTGDPLTIEITSNDPNRGIASFPDSNIGIWEDHGILSIPVDRIGPTDLELTVGFQMSPGTGQPGVDYVDISGTLTFDAGEASTTIDVPIIDDDLFEGETYTYFFTDLVGDNVDTANSEYLTFIWNEDLLIGQGRFASDTFYVLESAGSVTIDVERINGDESSYQYCVQFNQDGTAISGVDYRGGGISICTSMRSGTTSGSVTHDIYDNNEADGEKYFDVNFYPYGNETADPTTARVFIIDDDAPNASGGTIQVASTSIDVDESDGNASITVTRTGGSSGAAMVSYSTAPASAQQNIDYVAVSGTVLFAEGDTTPKVIQVPLVNDVSFEPDEVFSVTLSDVYGAAAGSELTTDVRILSSDNPGTLSFSKPSASMNEDGSVTLQVTRSGGTTGAVSVQYQTVGDTAESNVDFSSMSGTLNWSSGDASSREIQVFGIDDSDMEATEIFTVELVNPSGSAVLGVSEATIDIIGNDGYALPLTVLAHDLTGDTINDIITIRDGSVLAEIRSGADSWPQGVIAFFTSFDATVVDAVALPDTNGDGATELAILATRDSDGRAVVEIRNLTGSAAQRHVWFAKDHTPLAIRLIEDDADGNGIPELAVMSTRDSDGRILVEVKNAFGPTNPNTVWFMNGNTPIDMEIAPDKDNNGIPEVAVLSSRNSDGRNVTEIKNAAGATAPTVLWFMPDSTAIDLAAVDDKDNNGVPEIAVLSSRNSDGRNLVEVKNASGPVAPSVVWFMAGNSAVGLEHVHDADGNGVPEVAVLSTRDSDGRNVVEVKNAAGATNPNVMWYTKDFVARGLRVIPDTDGNGIEEALVLMIRDSDARILLEGRNAAGNPQPNHYWFSP